MRPITLSLNEGKSHVNNMSWYVVTKNLLHLLFFCFLVIAKLVCVWLSSGFLSNKSNSWELLHFYWWIYSIFGGMNIGLFSRTCYDRICMFFWSRLFGQGVVLVDCNLSYQWKFLLQIIFESNLPYLSSETSWGKFLDILLCLREIFASDYLFRLSLNPTWHL